MAVRSPILRRFAVVFCLAISLFYFTLRQFTPSDAAFSSSAVTSSRRIQSPIHWNNIPVRYPVASLVPLPTGAPSFIPQIQHRFGVETEHNKAERLHRKNAVKDVFLHSWNGYKKHAWLQDQVTPVTGAFKNDFGKRGATLIDALDTLIVMGLDKEFLAAIKAVKKIDFTTSAVLNLNVFETTIRYLGGLLGAYDLSDSKQHVLLDKAIELGDMLYAAFDTPNRLPITRWDWETGALNGHQVAESQAISAELGSLTLEFTRLSQITGEPKYYDAVQRITDLLVKHQNNTLVPGLFPISISPLHEEFGKDKRFTLGGMSDSLYEYFPKQYILLGGRVQQYKNLYERAIEAAKKYIFFRPMNPQNQNILISGNAHVTAAGSVRTDPEGQHLGCFTGGMVGIGAKIFNRTDELEIARQLVDGCIWAYDSMPTGVMPETFVAVPCHGEEDCKWRPEKWHEAVKSAGFGYHTRELDVQDVIKEDSLPPGFAKIGDRRYLLRPEAIESVFILYRITGDTALQDAAWRMFTAINNATAAEFANSAIADVTCPQGQDTQKLDQCETFWYAETLKYFYLIFSEPDVVSLDEYVFNTEAHPLRRPQVK